ncbi:MAG: ArgR family transcriptional regulator [Bryobacteraceae bacterium]
MNKTYRQGQILRLIKSHKIHTQERLAIELAALGVQTTQVTLSRDIRELGLVKALEGYRQVEGSTGGPGIEHVASEFLWDVTPAQHLLVLKTAPGHANSLAISLDREEWPEVVGTIAGDDTVLVVTPDNPTALSLQERLLGYLRLRS